MEHNDTILVPLANGDARVDTQSGTVTLSFAEKEACFAFKLNPTVAYLEDNDATPRPLTYRGCTGGVHEFGGGDGTLEWTAFLDVKRSGWLDYWVMATAPAGSASRVRCMHYGQDSEGGSAHRFEEFFILCPDRYGSAIPEAEYICLRLGVPSFRFDKQNNFPHEGGRTIIAPYFTALRCGADWLGVGTLEIPDSEYGLNMAFENGRAVIDFFYGRNLKIDGAYQFPRITMYTGKEKFSVGRQYIDRLYQDGLAQPQQAWREDWKGPIYCFFSDQMYEYQTDRPGPELHGEMVMTERYCNEQFLDRCLDFLEEKAIPCNTVIMDYGWFVMNGQWRPQKKRFADFKATIKRLQGMGKKVLVWYSPYFIAEESENYRAHPEISVKKPDGDPFYVVRFGSEVNYQSDFTHPSMRELVVKDFTFILSSEGLDADGIKVDCTHQPPTIDNVFYDPSWGTGEAFHYNASKFMYETAKALKPDCCINATAGNPLFNNTYDLHRIHDALEYNLDAYEERAWAALFCRCGISDLDDWPSYDIYTVRANLRKITYGVPSLYAAMKRGSERKFKASWGYSVIPDPDDIDVLSSLYQLYELAPIDLSQQITIDPFNKIFSRRYTKGPLEGFFAATTLCGNQAVAVYDDRAAHLVSISNVALYLPLPPNASNIALFECGRDGGRRPVTRVALLDGGVAFEAGRCSGPVQWYEITYTLEIAGRS